MSCGRMSLTSCFTRTSNIKQLNWKISCRASLSCYARIDVMSKLTSSCLEAFVTFIVLSPVWLPKATKGYLKIVHYACVQEGSCLPL